MGFSHRLDSVIEWSPYGVLHYLDRVLEMLNRVSEHARLFTDLTTCDMPRGSKGVTRLKTSVAAEGE